MKLLKVRKIPTRPIWYDVFRGEGWTNWSRLEFYNPKDITIIGGDPLTRREIALIRNSLMGQDIVNKESQ